MSEESVRSQIKEMAKLSILTNRISEVQIKNLKMYPFVFFEGVSKAEIKYNITNNMDLDVETDQEKLEIDYKFKNPETRHLMVSYHLTLDERLNGHLPKRFEAIETAVRTILWSQIRVEIFFNDKKVYESKNGQQ